MLTSIQSSEYRGCRTRPCRHQRTLATCFACGWGLGTRDPTRHHFPRQQSAGALARSGSEGRGFLKKHPLPCCHAANVAPPSCLAEASGTDRAWSAVGRWRQKPLCPVFLFLQQILCAAQLERVRKGGLAETSSTGRPNGSLDKVQYSKQRNTRRAGVTSGGGKEPERPRTGSERGNKAREHRRAADGREAVLKRELACLRWQ